MRVQGAKSVTISYENGEVETFEDITVDFTKTQIGRVGDADYKVVKYMSVYIPLSKEESTHE